MAGNFVTGGDQLGDLFRVFRHILAKHEESAGHTRTLENPADLSCVHGVGAVIEGQGAELRGGNGLPVQLHFAAGNDPGPVDA